MTKIDFSDSKDKEVKLFAEMELYCEWCGSVLEDGDCPECFWHSDLYDTHVIPAKEELAKRQAAKTAEKKN